jgi:hypothetical protein
MKKYNIRVRDTELPGDDGAPERSDERT